MCRYFISLSEGDRERIVQLNGNGTALPSSVRQLLKKRWKEPPATGHGHQVKGEHMGSPLRNPMSVGANLCICPPTD